MLASRCEFAIQLLSKLAPCFKQQSLFDGRTFYFIQRGYNFAQDIHAASGFVTQQNFMTVRVVLHRPSFANLLFSLFLSPHFAEIYFFPNGILVVTSSHNNRLYIYIYIIMKEFRNIKYVYITKQRFLRRKKYLLYCCI